MTTWEPECEGSRMGALGGREAYVECVLINELSCAARTSYCTQYRCGKAEQGHKQHCLADVSGRCRRKRRQSTT
jgi:hypothetical protein